MNFEDLNSMVQKIADQFNLKVKLIDLENDIDEDDDENTEEDPETKKINDRLNKLFTAGLDKLLISVYDTKEDVEKFKEISNKCGFAEKVIVTCSVTNTFVETTTNFS